MIVYVILIGYFILTIGVGLIATRRPKNTPEDYFLANRSLRLVAVFFTLIATNFSAFFFIGFAGEGYRIGYVYYAMMAFGTSFAALSFYIIGNKAWNLGKKFGYLTPIEMVGDLTGSSVVRNLYMIVMMGFMIPFLAVQPIGAGLILEQLTGGEIPFAWGATLLTVFIIAYVFVGGMRGIASMDIKNGILMLTFMVLAVVVVGTELGGITSSNEILFDKKPGLFSKTGLNNTFNPRIWISYMFLWLTCLPMFPQLFMRFLMAKDINTFKKSTILYTAIPPVLFIFPVIIGVLGHIPSPDLVGKASDNILPLMLVEYTPTWFGALVLTGALAAFMSTMDSIVLALSTIVTRDIFVPYFGKKTMLKSQVGIGKGSVVFFALLALIIALNRPASIFTIATMTFSGSAILFPITVGIFYGNRIAPAYYIVALVLGELTVIGFFLQWFPAEWLMGFLPVFPGLVVAGLIVVTGKVISSQQSKISV